jgi:hypothetical protein
VVESSVSRAGAERTAGPASTSHRWRPLRGRSSGGLALGAGCTSWLALTARFVLADVGIGCVETAEHAAVAGDAPAHVRGSAFGLLAATQSLGNFAASVVAGILWTALRPTWDDAHLHQNHPEFPAFDDTCRLGYTSLPLRAGGVKALSVRRGSLALLASIIGSPGRRAPCAKAAALVFLGERRRPARTCWGCCACAVAVDQASGAAETAQLTSPRRRMSTGGSCTGSWRRR